MTFVTASWLFHGAILVSCNWGGERDVCMTLRFAGLLFFAFLIPTCTAPCSGQTLPPTPVQSLDQRPGSISGTVVDRTGAVVTGAQVKLTRPDQSPEQEVLSGNDGQFSFTNLTPGPFQLTIAAGSRRKHLLEPCMGGDLRGAADRVGRSHRSF